MTTETYRSGLSSVLFPGSENAFDPVEGSLAGVLGASVANLFAAAHRSDEGFADVQWMSEDDDDDIFEDDDDDDLDEDEDEYEDDDDLDEDEEDDDLDEDEDDDDFDVDDDDEDEDDDFEDDDE